jgi:hypothetical protein
MIQGTSRPSVDASAWSVASATSGELEASLKSLLSVPRADVEQRSPNAVERVHQRFGIAHALGQSCGPVPPRHRLFEVALQHGELGASGEGASELARRPERLQQL